MPTNIGGYAKFLIALAVPALTLITLLRDDEHPTIITLFKILVAIGGAVAVYRFANTDKSWLAQHAKFIAGLITAVGQAVLVLLEQGLGFTDFSWSNWAGVLLALIGATGVVVIPNEPAAKALPTAYLARVAGD